LLQPLFEFSGACAGCGERNQPSCWINMHYGGSACGCHGWSGACPAAGCAAAMTDRGPARIRRASPHRSGILR
jgi:hypothetical protein